MNKLIVSSSPHVKSSDSIQDTMLDVILALMPAAFAAVYYFGVRALAMMAVSVISCVLFEFLWQKLTHKKVRITDLSAVVTGMLLAYCVPVTLPYWMIVVGAFVSIIVAKEFFGGIGHNFVNPAMAGRAFLLAAFPVKMTQWAIGRVGFTAVDVVTQATPLSGDAARPSALQLFLGQNASGGALGGCIGETCSAALILGGLYLLFRGTINLRIPLAYIATVGIFYCFTDAGPFYGILTGGVLLGAIFMATDYVTSPTTPWGHIIMGIGCGIITCVIRFWGGYPEGVTYAIILMNVFSPTLDRWTRPRVFGKAGEKA